MSIGSSFTNRSTSGTAQSQYRYRAWGDRYNAITETYASRLTYKAREEDPETGLIYMRNRYYSPRLERFLNEDPIREVGGLSGYRFASDAPIDHSDPLGLCDPPLTIVCVALGAGVIAGAIDVWYLESVGIQPDVRQVIEVSHETYSQTVVYSTLAMSRVLRPAVEGATFVSDAWDSFVLGYQMVCSGTRCGPVAQQRSGVDHSGEIPTDASFRTYRGAGGGVSSHTLYDLGFEDFPTLPDFPTIGPIEIPFIPIDIPDIPIPSWPRIIA